MIQSKVKSVMNEKGETILGLVEKTRLAQRTINRARGEMISRCTLDTLATIAGALGVKVKDLFEEE